MNVSDVYGVTQTGVAPTSASANPSANKPAEAQANAHATGKNMNYGFIALISFIGVLVGAKFLLEKKA